MEDTNYGGYQPSTPVSKYNEALYQINRLNNSWNKCNLYANKGKLISWKWELDVIWRELSADAKTLPDWERIKKLRIRVNNLIAKFQCIDRAKFYQALNSKEEFLRWLQNREGKGSKKADEDEDMMD